MAVAVLLLVVSGGVAAERITSDSGAEAERDHGTVVSDFVKIIIIWKWDLVIAPPAPHFIIRGLQDQGSFTRLVGGDL